VEAAAAVFHLTNRGGLECGERHLNQMAIDTVLQMGVVCRTHLETEGRNMRHKLFTASCMVAAAVIGAAPAYADNLHGNACGSSTSANPATSAPGNSATSPGSTHNEPGTVSVNGGTGGAAYNSARQGKGAPSNYDTSCAKVTAASTNNPNSSAGTPIVTQTPAPTVTQVPNNSKETRMTELGGSTGHTGGGTTK
jgi:hypothetical protein